MIYSIQAGDAYGPNREFIVEGPEEKDLETLHKEFLKLNQGVRTRDTPLFAETTRFVKWLIAEHGFTAPKISYLFTET